MRVALFFLLALLSAKPAEAQDSVEIMGTMAPEVVRRAIHLHVHVPLLRCYIERLRELPDLRGRWRVRFLIDSSGGVSHVSTVASELADPPFMQCAIEALRAGRFPAAPGMISVTMTFELLPRARTRPGIPRINRNPRGPYIVVAEQRRRR